MRRTKATLIRFICFVFLTAVRCITAHSSRTASRFVEDSRSTATLLVGGTRPRAAGLAVACLLSLLPVGCATVLSRPIERIPVTSVPDGAQVTLRCNGLVGTTRTTPTDIELNRRAEDCVITVTKEGFAPATVALGNEVTRTYWGNIILDGGLVYTALEAATFTSPAGFFVALGLAGSAPWFVDTITGSKHEHSPRRVSVVLEEQASTTAAGAQ